MKSALFFLLSLMLTGAAVAHDGKEHSGVNPHLLGGDAARQIIANGRVLGSNVPHWNERPKRKAGRRIRLIVLSADMAFWDCLVEFGYTNENDVFLCHNGEPLGHKSKYPNNAHKGRYD